MSLLVIFSSPNTTVVGIYNSIPKIAVAYMDKYILYKHIIIWLLKLPRPVNGGESKLSDIRNTFSHCANIFSNRPCPRRIGVFFLTTKAMF